MHIYIYICVWLCVYLNVSININKCHADTIVKLMHIADK